MGYMQLKRHLAGLGYPTADLDGCSGRNELLHLAAPAPAGPLPISTATLEPKQIQQVLHADVNRVQQSYQPRDLQSPRRDGVNE